MMIDRDRRLEHLGDMSAIEGNLVLRRDRSAICRNSHGAWTISGNDVGNSSANAAAGTDAS
ncbi:hypothetical protein [Nocardia sp. NPDC051570]|uniref:hypothetical protein n=1 Tax=Nocardia sp. NPDC051570 TaxID=3364324 RepID=UPI0037B38710